MIVEAKANIFSYQKRRLSKIKNITKISKPHTVPTNSVIGPRQVHFIRGLSIPISHYAPPPVPSTYSPHRSATRNFRWVPRVCVYHLNLHNSFFMFHSHTGAPFLHLNWSWHSMGKNRQVFFFGSKAKLPLKAAGWGFRKIKQKMRTLKLTLKQSKLHIRNPPLGTWKRDWKS